jgi:hypothetical protein
VEFAKVFKPYNFDEVEREILLLEAFLVHNYNRYLSNDYENKTLFLAAVGDQPAKLLITSKFDKSENQNTFLSFLIDMSGSRYGGRLDIGYLLNKIDLTEEIKF